MITNTIINQMQGKMEEAGKIMDEVKDQFFQDALTNQREFFGN
jgi:hypothetical protein